MSNENPNTHNDSLVMLPPEASDNGDSARTEPLTYHRKGHWFESGTAQFTFCELLVI
ncbi:MAG: hypothetical protein ACXABY_26995 [Candidatus Thorarchaeota archaeon]|jgi:hypothetical protein